MEQNFFEREFKYWDVAKVVKDIYMSDGAVASLLDFERVLDEVDLYAFANWELGELVSGPDVGKYRVTCVFMWPEKLMPDPRGAKRLIPFDCDIKYKRTKIDVPVKITNRDDFEPGTRFARKIEKTVWFVEITMPKALMSDIREGSVEFEDASIDLEDIDRSYEEDLDQEEFRHDSGEGEQQ